MHTSPVSHTGWYHRVWRGQVNMVVVFFLCPGINEDVVNIGHDKLIQVFMESVIHHVLKDRRGIGESEGHDAILEVAISGTEGSLPLISWLDADKVVGTMEVDLSEYHHLPELFNKAGNKRQGVPVLDSDLVQTAVIYT